MHPKVCGMNVRLQTTFAMSSKMASFWVTAAKNVQRRNLNANPETLCHHIDALESADHFWNINHTVFEYVSL